jgi:two-component system cell cycle sensor histidine kinase/response regulator CckA
MRLAENLKFDLLLSDVVMPNMHGPALAEQLSKLRPEMKVLFMSGYSEKAIAQNGILMPGVKLLQKPFTHKSLTNAVRESIEIGQN